MSLLYGYACAHRLPRASAKAKVGLDQEMVGKGVTDDP